MAEMRKFAVFDIDGTLIRWQLFHAIVHHLGVKGYIDQDTHENIKAARMTWKKRNTTDGFSAYERTLVHAYRDTLTTIKPTDYQTIVDEVFDEYKDQTFVYTRNLVRSLKRQGYLLFAISGSQEDIIQKIAEYYEFDAAIGSQLEQENGTFTGRLFTPVHEKAEALDKLVVQFGATYEQSIAVGDSMSDVPMLSAVKNPIVFNPNKELFETAQTNNWKIIVERKDMVYELENYSGQYVLAKTD